MVASLCFSFAFTFSQGGLGEVKGEEGRIVYAHGCVCLCERASARVLWQLFQISHKRAISWLPTSHSQRRALQLSPLLSLHVTDATDVVG